ncbi:MAG: hypothetical protein M5R42_06625 [Rhodocyclaceae bacterium]|nr:hypothetical protein [Rhodocyclaceae bacterium]
MTLDDRCVTARRHHSVTCRRDNVVDYSGTSLWKKRTSSTRLGEGTLSFRPAEQRPGD